MNLWRLEVLVGFKPSNQHILDIRYIRSYITSIMILANTTTSYNYKIRGDARVSKQKNMPRPEGGELQPGLSLPLSVSDLKLLISTVYFYIFTFYIYILSLLLLSLLLFS